MAETRTWAELGALVAQVRNARRLTQDTVAAAVRTSRTTVALFEQGRRLPDGDMLEQICRYVGLAENFWLPFKVRKLNAGVEVGVRCHCATYYTRVKSCSNDDERQRTDWVLAVKKGRNVMHNGRLVNPTAGFAKLLLAHYSHLFVGRTLIAVPRSTAGGVIADWPSSRIASAISALGSEMMGWDAIGRLTDIQKSATAASRPSIQQHLATLSIDETDTMPRGVLLVDDVVTRGTTLIACAKLLRDAGWPGEIDAVAIAYTRLDQDPNPGEGRVFSYTWDGRSQVPTNQPVLLR